MQTFSKSAIQPKTDSHDQVMVSDYEIFEPSFKFNSLHRKLPNVLQTHAIINASHMLDSTF